MGKRRLTECTCLCSYTPVRILARCRVEHGTDSRRHAIQALQGNLNSTANPGLNADALGQEASMDPRSEGNDHAFWDTLNTRVRNLRVVISGHDHGDEWCAREPSYDVIFCFSKHSGYGGYSKEGWGRGIRSLIFRSSAPSDGIETYILLDDKTTRAGVVLNNEYK